MRHNWKLINNEGGFGSFWFCLCRRFGKMRIGTSITEPINISVRLCRLPMPCFQLLYLFISEVVCEQDSCFSSSIPPSTAWSFSLAFLLGLHCKTLFGNLPFVILFTLTIQVAFFQSLLLCLCIAFLMTIIPFRSSRDTSRLCR